MNNVFKTNNINEGTLTQKAYGIKIAFKIVIKLKKMKGCEHCWIP